jgi:hypothetical protein
VKYFEKIAVGPKVMTLDEFYGDYIPKGEKKRIGGQYIPGQSITEDLSKELFPDDLKSREKIKKHGILIKKVGAKEDKAWKRHIFRHELTHYKRRNTLGTKLYPHSAIARFVEETAANYAGSKRSYFPAKGLKIPRAVAAGAAALFQEAVTYPVKTTAKILLPIAGIVAYKKYKKNK